MPTEYRDSASGNSGTESADSSTLDPADIDDAGTVAPAVASGKRRRGRPPGTGNAGTASGGKAKGKTEDSLDLSSLAGLVLGAHVAIAMMSNQEHWAISEDESKRFAKCASNVMRHYSIKTTQKAIDWMAFAGCCGMIYGPRIGTSVVLKGQRDATVRTARAAPSTPTGGPASNVHELHAVAAGGIHYGDIDTSGSE